MNTRKYYGQGRNTSKVGAMINQNSPHGYKSNQSAWLWVVLFVIAVVLFIAFMLSATPAYAMACDKCDEAGTRPNVVSVQAGKDNDTESTTLTVTTEDTHITLDPIETTPISVIDDTSTDNSSDDNEEITTPENEDNHPEVHNNNGHGNNEDGIDSSNPGNGPKNEDGNDPSAPIDDERGHKPNK